MDEVGCQDVRKKRDVIKDCKLCQALLHGGFYNPEEDKMRGRGETEREV